MKKQEILKLKNKGLLIVISGPTSVGKGTICKRLVDGKRKMWYSVSMTSRPLRAGEVEGVSYFFVTKEEFEENIKEDNLLEYATVHEGEYYGTPKKPILDYMEKGYDVVLDIDIQGALKVKELVKEAVFIFVLPPSMRELKNRFIKRNRGESVEEMMRRFETAYKEINEMNKYNYVVVNDNLETALKKVRAIITSERLRVDRIEEVYLDSIEEVMHESLIQE